MAPRLKHSIIRLNRRQANCKLSADGDGASLAHSLPLRNIRRVASAKRKESMNKFPDEFFNFSFSGSRKARAFNFAFERIS